MGIPGLFSKLKKKGKQKAYQWDENVNLEENIDISVKNYLIVDSSSFHFFALRGDSLKENFLAAIGIQDTIYSMFDKNFDYLQKVLNFELIFVKDGYEDAFVDPNYDEEKRINSQICLYNTSRAFEKGTSPSFLMNGVSGTILNRILKSRKIETINSEYEADFTCTIKCKELNRELIKTGDPRRAFCLTTDSDFILMSEALTIHPGDFPKTIEPDTKILTINVYSRQKAYRKFKFKSENDLVRACIFVGNDFTGHLSFSYPNLSFVFDHIRDGDWYTKVRYNQRDAYKFSMAFYFHDIKTFEKLHRANCKESTQAYMDFFMPEDYEMKLEKKFDTLHNEDLSEKDFIQFAIELFLAEKTVKKKMVIGQNWNPKSKKWDSIMEDFEFNLSDNLLDAIESLLELPPILSESRKDFTMEDLKKIAISDYFFLNRLQYGLMEIYSYLYEYKKADFDIWAVFNLEVLYRRYLGLEL